MVFNRKDGVPESMEFTATFDELLNADELSSLIAKVEAIGPAAFVTDLPLLENRFQFQRWMRDEAHTIARNK